MIVYRGKWRCLLRYLRVGIRILYVNRFGGGLGVDRKAPDTTNYGGVRLKYINESAPLHTDPQPRGAELQTPPSHSPQDGKSSKPRR